MTEQPEGTGSHSLHEDQYLAGAQSAPEKVRSAHEHSDVDSSAYAQHHTLGKTAGQAAAGNHRHKINDLTDVDTATIVPVDTYVLTWSSATGQWYPAAGGGGGGHTIQDEGVSLTARALLNFVGAGVTVTDTGTSSLVTIPSGTVVPNPYYHDAVRTVSTGNITLSGPQTINFEACVAGDRVLLAYQTTSSENGIWVVAAGAWTRATDADALGEIPQGAFVMQKKGFFADNTPWTQTTTDPVTPGVTGHTWLNILQIYPKVYIFGGKGSLIVGQSVWNPQDFPVGTEGQTLRVNAAAASGLEWSNSGSQYYHEPVRVTDYLANSAIAGLVIVDGVTLNDGDRVLLKNQTTTLENGIWVAHAGAWTRPSDCDAVGDIPQGAMVFVRAGSNLQRTLWTQSDSDPITPGVSANHWLFAPYKPFTKKQYLDVGSGAKASKIGSITDTRFTDGLDYVTIQWAPTIIGDADENSGEMDAVTFEHVTTGGGNTMNIRVSSVDGRASVQGKYPILVVVNRYGYL